MAIDALNWKVGVQEIKVKASNIVTYLLNMFRFSLKLSKKKILILAFFSSNFKKKKKKRTKSMKNIKKTKILKRS